MNTTTPITQLITLERIVSSEEPFRATLPVNEFRIFKELLNSGHLSGQVGPDHLTAPETMVEHVQITTSGRLLLEQLRKEKKDSGFWTVTWRWLGPLIGLLAGGIGVPLILKYIEKTLHT